MLLIFFSFLISISSGMEVELETSLGKLVGRIRTDLKDNTYYSFLSIPYAKPPIGVLRFKPPVPIEPWIGILNATNDLPKCPQYVMKKILGQEDCLYLNIHTRYIPKSADGPDKLKPVLFFIHGGSYVEGSGTEELFGAEYLMPEDIVLVTINYRLGLLGSLSSADKDLNISGNSGLKDQNMALKFVNKYIKEFGGDPNNVMLVGQSAGGASVHMHMLSPSSKGLFHKVIAMSGTAVNQWNKGILGTFEITTKKLGIQDSDKATALKKLQEISFDKILLIQKEDGLIIPINEPVESSPVIEKSADGFLQDIPFNLISTGNYTKVPFMFGYTDVDGLLFEVITRLYYGKPAIFNDFSTLVPNDLILTNSEREEVKSKIKKFYFGDEEPSEKNLDKATRLRTDIWFLNGIRKLLKALKSQLNNDVYFYRFSGDTKLNYMKRSTPETAKVPGACHIDDLGHLFKVKDSPEIKPGSKEEKVVKNLITLFMNFLKTGKPTLPTDEVQWKPVTTCGLNYVDIGTEIKRGKNPDQASFDFLNSINEEYKVGDL